MDVFIQPDSPRPLIGQIYDQLRDAIIDGRIAPGSRLTATRVLAAELDVSRATITDAYARLVAEGFAEGRRGGGTIVTGRTTAPVTDPATTALHPTSHAANIERYGSHATTARFDLTAGRTDPHLFPGDAWRRSVFQALRSHSDVGRYGDPIGSAELRRALARWIGQSRGIAAAPGRLVVTQGTGQAVDLIARALLQPGDIAAVEEPGYPPIKAVFDSQHVDVVGVPVDHHGLVVDALPDRARVVHVTPSHQYPLGSALTHDRRLALLDWAHRNDAAIIEDDYDSEFRHGRRPLEPLHRLDPHGRVLYVGTLSKTLSPALRIGYAVVPDSLVPVITALRRAIDAGPPQLIDAALTHFIDDGHLARHVRRSRSVYSARHRLVWDEIQRHASPDMTPLPGHAGLHLSLLAPRTPPDGELARRTARRDLTVSSLRRTYQFGEPQPGVIIGFGAIATTDIRTAIDALMACLDLAPT